MAGKKRKPEPESDPSSSNSDDSEFDEDGSEEGAAAGGGMDETEEDDELEAEMAALAAIRSEKRGGGAGKDKVRINNKPGLTASLEDFGWSGKANWIDHMVVVGEHNVNPILDINDDLARETAFYERALASAEVAVGKLKALGVAVRRPDDFYAEMVKSDEHMKRVRAELIFEQTSMETKDERRKAREQKRYGKQVQAEKLKERTLQKKESISKLDKFRKQRKRDGFEDNGKAPDGFEEEGPEKKKRQTGGGGQHGRSTPETRDKKNFKEDKFGFGGRKRLGKQNDKESARDMTEYKPASFDKGFREGKGWGDLGAGGGRGGRGRGGRGDGGRGGRGGGRGGRR